MTTDSPEPTDRDREQGQRLIDEITFGGYSWDGATETLARALAATRAEGVHEGRDEVLTVLERMLANPADAARVLALLEARS